MSDRHGRSHRDPSRHRGRSPPSFRDDGYVIEDKSKQSDFHNRRNKGKEPERASKREQDRGRRRSPSRSRGRDCERHERPQSRHNRAESNWNAFFKDYSSEYTNGVYTGPKPEGWVKTKTTVDREAEAKLKPSERKWNAFFRDYSDEYTKGYYTGPKNTSSSTILSTTMSGYASASTHPVAGPSSYAVPPPPGPSFSRQVRLPSLDRETVHQPMSYTGHLLGSTRDTNHTSRLRKYPPSASLNRDTRYIPPPAPTPPFVPTGGFPSSSSRARSHVPLMDSPLGYERSRSVERGKSSHQQRKSTPVSSSRQATVNMEPSQGRSHSSHPRTYSRAESSSHAHSFSRPPIGPDYRPR
ncbi:MAG: hypothetical protein STHCBS139747_007888 [Sporothrix thermara]